MRFGGNLFGTWKNPEEWAQKALSAGYSAVYFPVNHTAPLAEIDGYRDAARAHDLEICEIGIWNNLFEADWEKREANIDYAIRQLELAEYVGAHCCVNIAGTYNTECWDGPHPDNFTKRAFDEIVATSQRIIDAVDPKVSAYALEPMPWMYPDTPESYLDLIKAIDRKGFAAHVDIVNIINTPALYYRNGDVIRDWFAKLGPYIRACHAKDTILRDTLTVHLDECRPGTGVLDYETYLSCVDALPDKRICLMLEHMTEEEDYIEATKYIKGVAAKIGIAL